MTSSHIDSVLLVSKTTGVTSFASLYPIKRTIDAKVGHAGTLDKFAEGLMIVLTGSFTRLNPLFSSLDKRYIASIHFGLQTETLDPEGEIVATCPVPSFDIIQDTLDSKFQGTILQRPPLFSAIHIDGRRAHRIARNGEVVEMPEREISIYENRILSWSPPVLNVEIHCSKGTYIRSIARDLGIACGSCASLDALKRITIGPYSLENANDAKDFNSLRLQSEHDVELLSKLGIFARITLDYDSAQALRKYGRHPSRSSFVFCEASPEHTHALLLDPENCLVAVATYAHSQGIGSLIAISRKETFTCK